MGTEYRIEFVVDGRTVGSVVIPEDAWTNENWETRLETGLKDADNFVAAEIDRKLAIWCDKVNNGEPVKDEDIPDIEALYVQSWAHEFGITGVTEEPPSAREEIVKRRDVAEVEKKLWPIPGGIAEVNTEDGYSEDEEFLWGRPELVLALQRMYDELCAQCTDKFNKLKRPKPGSCPKMGKIKINSCYRRLGTTAAAGTKFEDTFGYKDSRDDKGHWSGYAVDLGKRRTGESFYPRLTAGEVHDAATAAGLIRDAVYTAPNPETGKEETRIEKHHYRPADKYMFE
jgi:hypothetical protein